MGGTDPYGTTGRTSSGTKADGVSDCGTELKEKKVGAPEGDARVRVCYIMHLPALSIWDREKLRTLMAGTVLSTLHVHVL